MLKYVHRIKKMQLQFYELLQLKNAQKRDKSKKNRLFRGGFVLVLQRGFEPRTPCLKGSIKSMFINRLEQ
jgi:hypothetical protein